MLGVFDFPAIRASDSHRKGLLFFREWGFAIYCQSRNAHHGTAVAEVHHRCAILPAKIFCAAATSTPPPVVRCGANGHAIK